MRRLIRRSMVTAVALAAVTSPLASVTRHLLQVEPAGAEVSGGTPSFSPSGIDGGGFQNVVAVDPAGSGLLLAGGDVSGFHRSLDWGRSWTTANRGVAALAQLRIASIVFSPQTPGKVYAGTGNDGAGGGLLVSSDNGLNWELRSTAPQFSGGNTSVASLPRPHPRSTGNLLAIDATAGLLYAATFKDGVMRSADDGRTWTSIGLSGTYLRSLALDPSNPEFLYAASYGSGVYRTTTASSDGGFAPLPDSPATAEELLAQGSELYAAAGPDGVFRSSDRGGTWAQLAPAALRTDGPVWTTIAGRADGVANVLFAGADNPTRTPDGWHSVMRSTDSGQTWLPVTQAIRISTSVGGPGGEQWWHASEHRTAMLGGASYTPAQISIDPTNPDRVFVAGRAGIWGTQDSASNWYPMTSGLGVTINRSVIADPNTPGRVYVANTDYLMLASTDGLARVTHARPPTARGTVGYSLALETSTTPSAVYLASGDRELNADGEIHSNPDPVAGGTWVDEGLAAVTGGKRPLAVAVQNVEGRPVIVAAVEEGGVWRKQYDLWTKSDGLAMSGIQRTKAASLSWTPGSPDVFLYDRETGVWRSNDEGRTWAMIWGMPSRGEGTGYVVADPTSPGRLYVSVGGTGLYVLTSATTGTVGTGITPTKLGSFSRPGAISVGRDGRLYAAEVGGQGAGAALSISNDNGLTWTDAADDYYHRSALFPLAMAVGPERNIYLSLNGNGAIRAMSPLPDTTAPTPPSAVSAAVGVDRVSLSWSPSTDDTAVDHYVVNRDGALLGGTASTSYIDTTVAAGTTYTYTVQAVDAAGNVSATSIPVTAGLPVPRISLRSSSSQRVLGNRLTMPRPYVDAGWTMVASISVRGKPSITSPTGWTRIGQTTTPDGRLSQATFYRLAGTAEPLSYSWSFPGTYAAVGTIVALSGVSVEAPIDRSSSSAIKSSAITAPSVTPSVGNTFALGFFGIADYVSIAPPASMTAVRTVRLSGANDISLLTSVKPLEKPTPSGAFKATASTAESNVGQLVVLRPRSPG